MMCAGLDPEPTGEDGRNRVIQFKVISKQLDQKNIHILNVTVQWASQIKQKKKNTYPKKLLISKMAVPNGDRRWNGTMES